MLDQATIDSLRHNDVAPAGHIIDGVSDTGGAGEQIDVISPIDGTRLTTLADGDEAIVARAVAVARAAFEDGRWSKMAPAARKAVMHRWADLVQANAAELAVLGVRDNGTEIGMAFRAEPGSAAATLRYYAEVCDKIYGEVAPTPDGILGMIHKEPVGVVGAIIPWNFPLMIGAWKLGPALNLKQAPRRRAAGLHGEPRRGRTVKRVRRAVLGRFLSDAAQAHGLRHGRPQHPRGRRRVALGQRIRRG